jgi:hypothetical protein
VPLGHSASSADETVKPACARHLYHDMGVIAFAGTNPLQTERLGDLLHATVGAGGPGAMATSAEWAAIAPHHGVRRKRTRVESLEEGDVFDAENVLC